MNPAASEDQTLHSTEAGGDQIAQRAVFGRMTYNYNDRYIVEFNGRYDGSSRFTPEHRYVFFPSASLVWRVSEEAFMQSTKSWLNNLKLRVSYGKLGSQPDSAYPYQALMASDKANYLLGGNYPNTVKAPNLMSPTLTWEKTETKNFGLEAGFLDNRLNLELDFYQRRTVDILVDGDKAYPNSLGVTPPRVNSGEIKTNGFELTLRWADKLSNGLRYNATFVLSDYLAKVVSFPSNSIKSLDKLYAGQTVGDIWGYITGGILQAEDLALINDGKQYAFYGNYKSGNIYPGDPWLKDLDGNGVINSGSNTVDDPGDRRVIGNNTPRFRFGLTLGASWKGFDANILMQGVAKRDYWIGSTTFWGGGTNNAGSKWMWNQSWKPEQPNAKFPRYRSTAGAPDVQSGWLTNAAYLRMKQVVLGYTLPAQLTQKFAVEKLRFTLSGYNLFRISEVPSVIDPDQFGDNYPQKRTIALGAQISF